MVPGVKGQGCEGHPELTTGRKSWEGKKKAFTHCGRSGKCWAGKKYKCPSAGRQKAMAPPQRLSLGTLLLSCGCSPTPHWTLDEGEEEEEEPSLVSKDYCAVTAVTVAVVISLPLPGPSFSSSSFLPSIHGLLSPPSIS